MKDTNEPNIDVWAIGDASNMEDAPLPATAQGVHLDVYFAFLPSWNIHFKQLRVRKRNTWSPS